MNEEQLQIKPPDREVLTQRFAQKPGATAQPLTAKAQSTAVSTEGLCICDIGTAYTGTP